MKKNNIPIIIKGAYGQPNLGDDILMVIIDNLIKDIWSNYSFLLPYKSKGYAEKYISKFLYNDKLIETNILIYGGGTQFYQFKNTSKNARIKLFKKIIQNPSYIIGYIINKHKSVNKIIADKKVALGLGIGPFLKEIKTKKQIEIEKLLSQFDLLITRDIASYEFAKQCNSNSYLGSDLCFVNNKYLPFKINKEKNKTSNQITLIIRDWDHTKDVIYLKSIIKFIEDNTLYKLKVVIFGNDNYCEKLLIKKKIEYIKWEPLRYTIQEFLDEIFDAELVISSRYHGCVLSSLYTIPFIPISIDPKLSLFSHEIYNEKKEWCYPYSIKDLFYLIEDFKNNNIKYIENIKKNTDILVNRNNEALSIFDNYILNEK